MGLRREVDDDVVTRQHLGEQLPVGDVAPDEGETRIVDDRGQILHVAGIGQRIERGYLHVRERPGTGEGVPDERRSDETGCPGH